MQDASPEMLSIFAGAIERPAPEERAAYLDAACGEDAALRRRIEGLLAAHDEAGGFLRDGPAGSDPVVTTDQPGGERPGATIGPYKLLEQIGEGGFGVVFMAEQTQPVRRKVALKILKPGMDSRQVVARFEAERQALALMDHPNIAKVFDGGATPSGRPYFVMELVRGVPITDFCDRNHRTPRQRLELFVSVCQAIQHAHQKGIIHRDIKPSNVLVTVHDTTPVVKVIDFGVAKALGQELTDKTLFTAFAQMVGTPLYMSPEQAGQSGLDVDTRSDIYSLGVLLYELLTGTTPFDKDRFQKAAYDEIRRIIREEEPPRPSTRLSDLSRSGELGRTGTATPPAAPTSSLASISAQRHTEPAKLTKLFRGEVDWIVMKCLEKDRGRRYETASAFAADVQRYLADEPVQACPPSARYRLRKFVRRNKRALAAAAVLVVAVLAVAGTLGWALRDRAASAHEAARERAARQTAVEQEATLALKEAERWQEQRKWPEALSAAKRAEGLLAGGGSDELRERIRELRRDVEMVLRLEDARLQFLNSAGDGKVWNYDARDAAYQRAFRDYGIDVETLPAERAAELIRARAVHLELAGALDHWAGGLGTSPRRNKLIAVARAVDSDEWRNRVRDALWAGQRGHAALAGLAASEQVRALPPITVRSLAITVHRAGLPNDAVALLRDAQQRHPDDYWINFELAYSLTQKQPPSWDEAVRFFSVALALRPRSIATLNNLASALKETGRPDEAIPYLRKAIEIDPTYATTHTNLGNALLKQGRPDEAIASYKRAIELDPKYANPHISLGKALSDQKKPDEAIAEYLKAIALDPKDALAHSNLGSALSVKGRPDEAIPYLRKAIALDPDYAPAHTNLGLALRDQKKLDEAVASHRKAIELDPKSSAAHNNLGLTLLDQGKLDEAVGSHKKAVELDPKNALVHYNLGLALANNGQVDMAVTEFRAAIALDPNYAPAHGNLGVVLTDQKKPDEAIASYKRAIELDPRLAMPHNGLGNALMAQKKPEEAIAEYRKAIALDPRFAMPHYNLGNVLYGQKKPDEAIAAYRKAIELDPKYAPAHDNLGVALSDQKKPDEAVACYKKAIELDPKLANAHHHLGVALRAQGKPDEAVACYKKAIELEPKSANAHISLGNVLSDQGKLDEAVASYKKAIEADPKCVRAHSGLGNALHDQRKWDEAVASHKKAIELEPKDALRRYNLGCALQGKWQLDEAISAYRKAIELDPKFAMAHNSLGIALESRGRPDEAVASFRKAIEIDPSHALAHRNLARILQTKGEVDLALTHYRRAAEGLKPPADKTTPYVWLSWGFRGQGKLDEAIASYRNAVDLDPKNGTLHFCLGGLLQSQGEVGEAIACYRRAVEVDPKNVAALNALAWALATCADAELRDPAGALRHAETCVELAPKYAPGWQTLAWARYRTGDWKGAVAAMTRVKDLGSKGDSREWFLLAVAHWKLGDKAEARAWYDKAVEWMEKNQPMNEELRRFRGEASELLGVAVEVAPPPREKK